MSKIVNCFLRKWSLGRGKWHIRFNNPNSPGNDKTAKILIYYTGLFKIIHQIQNAYMFFFFKFITIYYTLNKRKICNVELIVVIRIIGLNV